MKKMRIDRFLSNMGCGSRSQIKDKIKHGKVAVNGEKIKSSNVQVNVEDDEITYFGEIVDYEEFVYILLNKPAGVISATEDKVHETVIDLLDDRLQNRELFPVGRLDIDTVGLLIISDDGNFAHKALSPKKHVAKKYYARLGDEIEDSDWDELAEKFAAGIVLDDDYECKEALLEKGENRNEIYLSIYEGKYHQVKRMFEAVGNEVTFLKRVKFGNLSLDPDLEEGQYRKLTMEELLSI